VYSNPIRLLAQGKCEQGLHYKTSIGFRDNGALDVLRRHRGFVEWGAG
jgi:hypothetical protein